MDDLALWIDELLSPLTGRLQFTNDPHNGLRVTIDIMTPDGPYQAVIIEGENGQPVLAEIHPRLNRAQQFVKAFVNISTHERSNKQCLFEMVLKFKRLLRPLAWLRRTSEQP